MWQCCRHVLKHTLTLAEVLSKQLLKSSLKYNIFQKEVSSCHCSTSCSEGLKPTPVSFGLCNSAAGSLTLMLQCSMWLTELPVFRECSQGTFHTRFKYVFSGSGGLPWTGRMYSKLLLLFIWVWPNVNINIEILFNSETANLPSKLNSTCYGEWQYFQSGYVPFWSFSIWFNLGSKWNQSTVFSPFPQLIQLSDKKQKFCFNNLKNWDFYRYKFWANVTRCMLTATLFSLSQVTFREVACCNFIARSHGVTDSKMHLC